MDWIDVNDRVPENRRPVLAWGLHSILGMKYKSRFIGQTRFNPTKSGGKWDAQISDRFSNTLVTHWCEIVPPNNRN